MYSVVYSNEGFEDEFQPLEIKPDAENGFWKKQLFIDDDVVQTKSKNKQ